MHERKMSGGHPEEPVRYLFKLRRNIALEGDLFLARMELETILSALVQPVRDVEAIAGAWGEGFFRGCAAPSSDLRTEGTKAYTAEAPFSALPDLIKRVSFVQQIYVAGPATPHVERQLRDLEAQVGPVLASAAGEGRLFVVALPHSVLFECSETAVRRSADGAETRQTLQSIRAALLGQTEGRGAVEITRKALSAASATSHLSHGVHYYKAKFFPRLARSLLNVCAIRSGEAHPRVLDNFAGSGTTLLEATLLGLLSFGVDLDPLSASISSAKLEWLGLEHGLLASEAQRIRSDLAASGMGVALFPPEPALPFPSWLMKNRKMNEDLAGRLDLEIRTLRRTVSGGDPLLRNLLRVWMSDAITRKVRMRFLGTGVGRFSLVVGKTPLPDLFLRSLRHGEKSLAAWEWLRENLRLKLAPGRACVGDARRLPEGIGTFDLLLTSPPYLPASSGRESYAKAHALSLIALGMKDAEALESLAGDSVGAMGFDADGDTDFRGLTPREHETVEWLSGDDLRSLKAGPTARYFLDMRWAFIEMNRVLKPGARAVVVSGKQSAFYRFSTREPLHVVPCAELLAEEAERAGFVVEALHDLQLQKANRNARPRSLDDYYETLIMLRKAGE